MNIIIDGEPEEEEKSKGLTDDTISTNRSGNHKNGSPLKSQSVAAEHSVKDRIKITKVNELTEQHTQTT